MELERPTIADIDLAPYPNASAWIGRIKALPGYRPMKGLQHRGGPVGFLRVRRLRRQSPVAHRRLKIDGEAQVLPLADDPQLAEQLAPQAAGEVERLFRIRVEAFDWNCPQFISPRFTAAELEAQLRPLQERIAELEDGLQGLRRPMS